MRRRSDVGLISGICVREGEVGKSTNIQFVAFLLIICHDDDTITDLRARWKAGVTDSLIAVDSEQWIGRVKKQRNGNEGKLFGM